jgi:hypothetical protein
MPKPLSSISSLEKWLPEFLLAVIAVLGFIFALRTGAPDFKVFTYAGDLVLNGKIESIYAESPDRFLYAPGFAIFFALFAVFPYGLSISLWTGLKILGLYSVIRKLKFHFSSRVIFLALLVVTRPILIDFRYGNVNSFLLILGLHFLLDLNATDGHLYVNGRRRGSLFGAFAFLKILFLPAAALTVAQKKWKALDAFIFGMIVITVLPLVIFGFSTTHSVPDYFFGLYGKWWAALQSKGLPLETHNQSVLAFLFRILGGVPSRSLYLGGKEIQLGWAILNEAQIFWIFRIFILGIGLLGGGVLWKIYGLTRLPEPDQRKLLHLGMFFLSLLWLPSHLIWKPYFLLGFPAILVAIESLMQKKATIWIFFLAGLTLFSGLDLLGPQLATQAEAWCIHLWIYFVWLGVAVVSVFKKPEALTVS